MTAIGAFCSSFISRPCRTPSTEAPLVGSHRAGIRLAVERPAAKGPASNSTAWRSTCRQQAMGDMLGHGIGLKVQQGLSMGRRMEVLGMEFGMCYDCSACATTAAHVQGLQPGGKP